MTIRPLFALVLVVVINVSTPLTVTAAVTFALLAQCVMASCPASQAGKRHPRHASLDAWRAPYDLGSAPPRALWRCLRPSARKSNDPYP